MASSVELPCTAADTTTGNRCSPASKAAKGQLVNVLANMRRAPVAPATVALAENQTGTGGAQSAPEASPLSQERPAWADREAQRSRFADGAVSLSQFGQIVWTTPSDTPTGPGRQSFGNWLNSEEPVPQTGQGLQDFMQKTDINCYQWATFAALQSGAIDRQTARSYLDGVSQASGVGAKTAALYGPNKQNPINVEYKRDANGQLHVGSITGTENLKKGDIISFNGATHVMTVTGRDSQGRLQVASFPTVVFGDSLKSPKGTLSNAYNGSFEGFLQANLDYWHETNEAWMNPKNGGNLFMDVQIAGGTPAFIK